MRYRVTLKVYPLKGAGLLPAENSINYEMESDLTTLALLERLSKVLEDSSKGEKVSNG